MIRFGPSGNSESFYDDGNKSSVQMPEWLNKMGLTAYEYQCNKGVRIGKEIAVKLGEEAKKNNIFLSIHGPYYISMASVEKEKRDNSKRHILYSMEAAKWMGAKRVIIHTGACTNMSREKALDTAMQVMRETISEADALGLGNISMCPELLGKINQLGSLDEIMAICGLDERIIPCIDFGHLHARGMGAMNSAQDFMNALNTIENEIGYERLKNIHIHFSRIEFTKGGEKKHWTLADKQYGPEFEHLAEAIALKKMEPVIICESRDGMAEDAVKMKNIYEEALRRIS